MDTQLVPKIRFKEFEGEWALGKAGAYFVNRSEKGNDDLPVLSVVQTSTRIVKRNSQDRDFENAAKASSNKQVHRGDLAYNTMRMWQGAVAIANERGMVSAAYTVLQPKSYTSSEFFNYLFRTTPSLYKLWAYSYGITNDRLRLYFKDFAAIPFRIPTLTEQQKIATFLTLVDRRLATARRQVVLLKKWKRSVSNSLFSLTDHWTVKRLGDVGDFRKGRGISKADIIENGTTQCIRYGELYTTYGEVIDSVISTTNVPVKDLTISTGGEVLIPASGETAIDIATAACITVSGVALGSDMNILTTDIDGSFLAYFLSGPAKIKLAGLAQGVSVMHLYSQQLSGLKIKVPTLSEQTRIATILTTIDSRISAAQQEVAGWEEWKRGLLQKMMI